MYVYEIFVGSLYHFFFFVVGCVVFWRWLRYIKRRTFACEHFSKVSKRVNESLLERNLVCEQVRISVISLFLTQANTTRAEKDKKTKEQRSNTRIKKNATLELTLKWNKRANGKKYTPKVNRNEVRSYSSEYLFCKSTITQYICLYTKKHMKWEHCLV